MTPPPLALGLILCEKIIVEERTQNTTLVSTFTTLRAEEFPFRPERFVFAAVLSGGQGAAAVDLVINHLETDEEIYWARQSLPFPGRLAEVRLAIHVRECWFPVPGEYDATLFVGGDSIARRKFSVLRR